MRVNEIIGDNGGLDDPDMPIIFDIIKRKLDAGQEVWFNEIDRGGYDGKVIGFSYAPRNNGISNRHFDMHVYMARSDGKTLHTTPTTVPVSADEMADGTFKKDGGRWLLSIKPYPNGKRE
jgi:hypothetical protein